MASIVQSLLPELAAVGHLLRHLQYCSNHLDYLCTMQETHSLKGGSPMLKQQAHMLQNEVLRGADMQICSATNSWIIVQSVYCTAAELQSNNV